MAAIVPLTMYMAFKPLLQATASTSTGNMRWQLWTHYVCLLMAFTSMLTILEGCKQKKYSFTRVCNSNISIQTFLKGKKIKAKLFVYFGCHASQTDRE